MNLGKMPEPKKICFFFVYVFAPGVVLKLHDVNQIIFIFTFQKI